MNRAPALSLEALRHLPNEAIFHMVEAGVCKEAETIAAGRAIHGKWITGEQASEFRARAAKASAGLALAMAAVAANAMDAEQTAQAAAVADGATTAAALSMGAVETNPVVLGAGVLPITALKVAMPRLVRDASPETRRAVLTTSTGVWGGLAVHNIVAVLLQSTPIGLACGIAAGVYAYQHEAAKFDAEELAKAQAPAVVAEVQP
jgi:hypothetical protein